MHKDIAPAYIEVGSSSFQVRKMRHIYILNFKNILSDYRMHHH